MKPTYDQAVMLSQRGYRLLIEKVLIHHVSRNLNNTYHKPRDESCGGGETQFRCSSGCSQARNKEECQRYHQGNLVKQ